MDRSTNTDILKQQPTWISMYRCCSASVGPNSRRARASVEFSWRRNSSACLGQVKTGLLATQQLSLWQRPRETQLGWPHRTPKQNWVASEQADIAHTPQQSIFDKFDKRPPQPKQLCGLEDGPTWQLWLENMEQCWLEGWSVVCWSISHLEGFGVECPMPVTERCTRLDQRCALGRDRPSRRHHCSAHFVDHAHAGAAVIAGWRDGSLLTVDLALGIAQHCRQPQIVSVEPPAKRKTPIKTPDCCEES